MKYFKISDKGKIRKNNEDACFATDRQINKFENLFIVADGVGGTNGGEIASKLAIKSFIKAIKEKDIISLMDNRYKHLFQTAISKSSRVIYDKANSKEKIKGMCSTFLACTISNNKLYAANIGDSRLYLMTRKLESDEENNISKTAIVQITQDNAEIVETRVIPKNVATELSKKYNVNIENISPIVKKNRYLTKAIGAKSDVVADYYEVDLQGKIDGGKELKVLLCTDGVYDMLSSDEILEILFKEKISGNKRLKELVKRAKEKGGRDNITAVLIEI